MTRASMVSLSVALISCAVTTVLDQFLIMGHETLASYATLLFPAIWFATLFWALRRDGKRSLWLLGLAPIASLWLIIFVALIGSCLFAGECL